MVKVMITRYTQGFIEVYEEGEYKTYDEALTVAIGLLNHLTAREREFNTVEIINEQGEIVWGDGDEYCA